MQILVTGATGFVGVEVVRRLNAEGVRPRITVRREELFDGRSKVQP